MRDSAQPIYDAAHRPCSGLPPTRASGTAARAWGWEIHPVYAIDVWTKKSLRGCKADSDSVWTPLDQCHGTNEPPVVKSGVHVYEVRRREGHRDVGFRCAAVWSAVVAKVTGAIGYAKYRSRLRDPKG